MKPRFELAEVCEPLHDEALNHVKSINELKEWDDYKLRVERNKKINRGLQKALSKPYYYLLTFIFLCCMIAVGIEQWRFFYET